MSARSAIVPPCYIWHGLHTGNVNVFKWSLSYIQIATLSDITPR